MAQGAVVIPAKAGIHEPKPFDKNRVHEYRIKSGMTGVSPTTVPLCSGGASA
jgi:hypothetical protein